MSDWHPEDIKAAVRKRGYTLTALGASNGLSRQAMSLVLVRPWAEAEDVIARFLDVPPAKIWPSRYNSNGSRKQPQPKSNRQRRTRFITEAARP